MDNQTQQLNSIERLVIGKDNLEFNQDSSQAVITGDGRYIAFMSLADNLIANDRNDFPDIFVYDRNSKTAERVSIANDGSEANSFSKEPVISDDGRYIVFVSEADNLVANDLNKNTDIFIRDRQNKTTERISLNSDNIEAESYSFSPTISNDVRHVAFESDADNLVAEDNNRARDVFLRDRNLNTTEVISVSSDNILGNKRSKDAAINGDGRYVVFESDADNLVAEDNNDDTDIFLRDRDNKTTEVISISTEGLGGNGYSFNPVISDDGRYVVFESKANNLVPDDNNSKVDIFLRDRTLEITTRISEAADGTESNGDSFNPVISDDGRYVIFESKANNLVPDDTNNLEDIFVRDLFSGTLERINLDAESIQANNKSFGASISDLGQYITFSSEANNLIVADSNGAQDIFIKEYKGLLDNRDLSNFSVSNVRRFYEQNRGNHFYTADENEAKIIKAKSEAGELDYQDENIDFAALTNDRDAITGETIAAAKPVYRFFNSHTGAHFYTMNEAEKDTIQSNDFGYDFEGISYYAFTSQPAKIDTIPLYRMFNSQSGTHLYTVDNNELDYLQNNAPHFSLENNGEAAFYVLEV